MESPLRRSAPPGLRLIETFRWDPAAGFVRLEAHLGRLAAAAAALAVALDRAAVETLLATVSAEGPIRVRLTVGFDGAPALATTPLAPDRPPWTVVLAERRLRSDDPWLGVKSTKRPAYDAARAALPAGAEEAILLNERDELCDGTITTAFVDLGAGLLTPPLACGVLPGVLRAELLAQGRARERRLTPSDLAHGSLFVGNSLRGLIPARLHPASA